MGKRNDNNNTWLAIVFIILGAVFLLDNFNFLPFYLPYYLFSWKTLFVLIGAVMLATGKRQGFVFLIIGTVFLLPEFIKDFRYYVRDWWPLIFLAIGVMILLKQKGKLDFSINAPKRRGEHDGDIDYLDEVVVFGGGEKVITSKNFKGGKTSTIFGGIELNMAHTELSILEESKIETLTMFGGTTFIVPDDWTIKNNSMAVFGGFSDQRKHLREAPDSDKVLIINGFVAFGGIEIKRA